MLTFVEDALADNRQFDCCFNYEHPHELEFHRIFVGTWNMDHGFDGGYEPN